MCSYLKMLQLGNDRFNDVILKFCSSFFDVLNLNHFWYYKLTNDGNISFTGSKAEWTELFAAEKFFLIYPQLRHPKFLNQSVNLHKDVQDEFLKKIYDTSASKFGISQSLVFVNKIPEGVEEFGFSSSSCSEAQTSLFLSEMPLFRLFIRKFKLRNHAVLDWLENNQVNLGNIIGPAFYEDNRPKMPERLALLEKMGLGFGSPLTPREVDVITLILLGHSAGKIAPKIYLSKRTVEHHIERIKDKLGCSSKAELIQKAREMESFGFFANSIPIPRCS